MMTITEKQDVARELRRAGLPIWSIAKRLGCSPSSVSRYTVALKLPPAHPRYKTAAIKHDTFSPDSLTAHPERYVLVGFLAADGCISRLKNSQDRLIIRLAKKDRSVLEVFNNVIADGTRTISEGKLSFAVDFPSNQISNDLARFGIVPRKTAIYSWPTFLQGDAARLFLLGFFYGDGCFHRYPNRDIISFVTTVVFAEGVRAFLYDNKIVDHCVVSVRKKSPNYAQLVFQGRHANRLGDWMFRDAPLVLLPRKHPPPTPSLFE